MKMNLLIEHVEGSTYRLVGQDNSLPVVIFTGSYQQCLEQYYEQTQQKEKQKELLTKMMDTDAEFGMYDEQKCIDELNGIEHYTFLVEFMFKTGENDYSHLRLLEAENEEHAYQKALKWFPENYPQSEFKGCIVHETI